jgi:hypothetical protein
MNTTLLVYPIERSCSSFKRKRAAPTPKPKSRANYSDKDYFARVGRGLAAAFSGVDERLTELANIKKSEWTPEAEEGLECLVRNLKEVSKKADAYAVDLKSVLKRNHA